MHLCRLGAAGFRERRTSIGRLATTDERRTRHRCRCVGCLPDGRALRHRHSRGIGAAVCPSRAGGSQDTQHHHSIARDRHCPTELSRYLRLFSASNRRRCQRPAPLQRTRAAASIGERFVYDQFDKSKAWDSPENLPLSQTSLSTFRNLGCSSPAPGQTDFLFVTGTNTIFDPGTNVGWRDIADGPSNTITTVGVSASGISWAEPNDMILSKPAALPPGTMLGAITRRMPMVPSGFCRPRSLPSKFGAWPLAAVSSRCQTSRSTTTACLSPIRARTVASSSPSPSNMPAKAARAPLAASRSRFRWRPAAIRRRTSAPRVPQWAPA